VKNFAIQPILSIVCSLHDADPSFSYADLEGRLDGPGKQMLAAAVLSDHSDEMLSVDQAEAYLKVLQSEEKQVRAAELRAQIREAEREGKIEVAFGLMEELSRVQRG
jgi:hypothetical protein